MKYFKIQFVDAVLLKKNMHDAPRWFWNGVDEGKITLCKDALGNIIDGIICVRQSYGDVLCPFGNYLVRDSYGNLECIKGSIFEKDYKLFEETYEKYIEKEQ